MSHSVAMDVRFYLDHYDLSGDSNSVDLGVSTRVVEDECFGQTVALALPGVAGWSMGAAGLLAMDDNGADEVLHGKWDRSTSLFTMSPTGTEGEKAYFGQAFQSQLGRPQVVGDAIKWTWGGAARGLLIPGSILHTKTSHASSGNGTAVQLGAVASGKSLYAMLHVFSAPGTNVVVKVQSDDNSGFSSATDRITFTTVTSTPGAELKSVAGSITDDYWRAVWTVTGGGPYVLAVAAGIL